MCQKENDIPTPCRVEGDSCGGDARGKCVADGLCCSEGKITIRSLLKLKGRYIALSPQTGRNITGIN